MKRVKTALLIMSMLVVVDLTAYGIIRLAVADGIIDAAERINQAATVELGQVTIEDV